MVGLDDGGEDEAGAAGLQHVGGGLAAAVLRSGVGDAAHAEGGGVVVRGLLGVAHGEDDRVHALDREGVLGFRVRLSHGRSVPPPLRVRNSSGFHWASCTAGATIDGSICTG